MVIQTLRRTLLLLTLICFVSILIAAQLVITGNSVAFGGTFTAELDKTQGSLEDQFVLTLTVSGSKGGDPELPPIDGVAVVGSNSSNRISLINGSIKRETIFQIGLQASRPGTFEIPSLTVKVDDKDEHTLPLKFTVEGAGQMPPDQGSVQQNDNLPNGVKRAAKDGIGLIREINRKEVYVGEAFVSTLQLVNKVQVLGATLEPESSPDMRRIPFGKDQNFQKIIGGERFNVIQQREILVPLRAGMIKLPPVVVKASVLMPRGNKKGQRRKGIGGLFEDLFDDPFMGGGQPTDKVLTSEELEIKVKPLPEAGKPQQFSGLVGQFQAKAELSKQSLKSGETSTLTITINGSGYVEAMSDVALDFGDKVKVYSDKPTSNQTVDQSEGAVHGERQMKFALVPTGPGPKDLGTWSLTYFDPKTEKYVAEKVPLGALNVAPSSEELVVKDAKGGSPGSEKTAVKGVEDALVGLHRAASLDAPATLSSAALLQLLLLGGLPLLVGLGSIAATSIRDRRRSDKILQQRVKAQEAFKKLTLDSSKYLAAGDMRVAQEVLAKDFRAFLGERFGLPGTALTARELRQRLQSRGLEEEILTRIHGCLKKMEDWEFSGQAATREGLERLLTEIDVLAKVLLKYR